MQHGKQSLGQMLVAANLITQVLKPALAQWRGDPFTVAAEAWPSGHSTAAMALALAAIYAAPATLRALVGVCALTFAGGVAVAVVVLGWHYPSDAVGGFAVAGAVMLAAFAAQSAWEAPGAQRTSSSPFAPRERMNSRSESRLR